MAKRGRDWEEILEAAFASIAGSTVVGTDPPVAVIKYLRGANQFIGAFRAKGMCDLEGGWRGTHVCIEAKQVTSGPRFSFGAIRPDQLKRMEAVDASGGLAGVAVRHAVTKDGSLRCYYLPYGQIARIIEQEGKSVRYDDPLVNNPPYRLRLGARDLARDLESALIHQLGDSIKGGLGCA